jgi:hypothetical protein
MSQESLRKLWLVLALIGFGFAFAAHARLQGGPFEFIFKPLIGVVFKEGTPQVIVAMWGIYFLGAFLIATNHVLSAHAKAEPLGWKERYPFRLFDLPASSDIGKKAQFIAFGFLTLAPIISMLRFWSVLLGQGILCTRPIEGGDHVLDLTAGPFGLPADWSMPRAFGDEYRLANFDGKICSVATTWFPVVSPMLLAIATFGSIYVFIKAMRTLFRPVAQVDLY